MWRDVCFCCFVISQFFGGYAFADVSRSIFYTEVSFALGVAGQPDWRNVRFYVFLPFCGGIMSALFYTFVDVSGSNFYTEVSFALGVACQPNRHDVRFYALLHCFGGINGALSLRHLVRRVTT